MVLCSVTQSYLILCNPMDCSPPVSFSHGILQARILEWVATSYSRRSSWPRDWTQVSCVSCTAGRFFSTSATWKTQDGATAAAAAKPLQSSPTLCDPIDGSPPGSPAPGILQVRTLEWVAISFSNAGKWKVKVKPLSCVRLLVTPWTAAHQDPPSMGFSRREDWSVACLIGSCTDTTISWLILIFYKQHKFLWLKLYYL